MSDDQISVLQGGSEVHYHVIADPLTARRTSPRREAVLRYLSRIDPSRFPEFVADLLVSSERHTLVSVTDGPGDEKQDILTMAPTGERHLTQCKHTVHFERAVPGDELDLMLAACLRKNCKSAVYVTNANLSTQAKRYVEDGEYARGWPKDAGEPPRLEYWDATRIWNRLSGNAPLLNKWFGGMAQAHGLRRFRFDVLISELPAATTVPLDARDFSELLGTAGTDAKSRWYRGGESAEFQWMFSDGVRSNIDLDIEYVGANERNGDLNIPVRTISVEVNVAEAVERFDPNGIRDQIACELLRALPTPAQGQWWHAVATRPTAYVFLADIDEPKIVRVSASCAYVRVVDDARSELDWVMLNGAEYRRPEDAEEQGELRWTHPASGTEVLLGMEQDRHPLHVHEQSVVLEGQLASLRSANMLTVSVGDFDEVERVRRLADITWTIAARGDSTLYVAIPRDAKAQKIGLFLAALARAGLSASSTSEDAKNEVLELLREQSPTPSEVCSFESSLVTPAKLHQRILWLSREFPAPGDLFEARVATAVLKYKANYEAAHGYDLLGGKAEANITGAEIPGLLFSPLTLRGDRMLDIGQKEDRWSIHFRVREHSLAASTTCVDNALREFETIASEILGSCS